MQDLTQYGSSELSMWVFNDEYLYDLRHNQDELIGTLDELFVYDDEQLAELLEDLISDTEN